MDAYLEEEITERVRRGEAPDDIATAVLRPRPWLDEDARSALWLYAWVRSEHRSRFGRRPDL